MKTLNSYVPHAWLVPALVCFSTACSFANDIELKNAFLSLRLDTTTSLAQVTNLKTGTVYEQLPGFDVRNIKDVAVQVKDSGRTAHVSFTFNKIATVLEYRLSPDSPVIDVKLDMDPNQKIQIVNFPVPFTVCGKGFEWLISDGYGLLYKVDEPEMPDRSPKAITAHCVEWAGLFHPETGEGYTLIDKDFYHGCLSLKLRDIGGKNTLVPEFGFGSYLGKFQEPRNVTYIFQQSGGYVSIALNFRKYLMASGSYRSLAQKEKDNPAIAKLRGAPVFWLYPGHNGEDVLKILDDMAASGINKGIVGLGFNAYISPEQAREIQKKFNGIVGIYDNYFDLMSKEWWQDNGYPKAEVDWMERYKRFGRIPEHVSTDERGELRANRGKYGSRYVDSPVMSLEAAKERLQAELPDYRFTYRFFDVTPGAALWLDQDYNPQHPANPKQSMEARLSVFKLFYDHGVVLGGEGGGAWATPYYTVSEGGMSCSYHMEGRMEPVPPTEEYKRFNMSQQKKVPANGIVYGDARVATWAWGDNTLVQPDYLLKKDLFNILYGTAPSYHISLGTYQKNKAKILESYNRVVPVYEKLFGAALVNHRWLTPDRNVQQTDFSNGWHVVVNFGSTEFALASGVKIAPMGYHTWQDKSSKGS